MLRECVRRDIPVVFATGKHRGPWVQQLLSQAESKTGERSAVCVCVFFLLQYSVLTSNNLMIANGHFQHLLLPICQSFSVDLFRIWLAEMKKVCLISCSEKTYDFLYFVRWWMDKWKHHHLGL